MTICETAIAKLQQLSATPTQQISARAMILCDAGVRSQKTDLNSVRVADSAGGKRVFSSRV